MDRHRVLLIKDIIGYEVRINGAYFRLIASTPHIRKTDGQPTKVLTWETNCRDCDERREFKTGMTQGDFHSRCLACTRKREMTLREKEAAERIVESIPACGDVWEMFVCMDPQQMSLARNTPKKYNPAYILRSQYQELENEYTIAELNAGVAKAIAEDWLYIDKVGVRSCGHAVKGILARTPEYLVATGRLEAKQKASVFA